MPEKENGETGQGWSKDYYGHYPEEKAREEADQLQKKIESGEAQDYEEADLLIEKEWRDKPADILLIEPFSPSPMVGFSVGLASLGANLEASTNMKAEILDCNLNQTSPDKIKRYDLVTIKENEQGNKSREFNWAQLRDFIQSEHSKTRVFGIKSNTPTYPEVKRIASILKETNPNCSVIVGGQHVSATPREVLENNPQIDLVVIGEGEKTLIDLMEAIKSGESLENIDGVAFREKEEVVINKPRKLMSEEDLGELTYRYDRLVDRAQYIAELYEGKKSAVVMTSRGCPFGCSFCSSSEFWGTNVRYRPTGQVMGELSELVLEKGIDRIYFEDDIFNLNLGRLEELCDEIAKRREENPDFRFTFHCECRVDTFPDDLTELESILGKMKEAGCDDIFFGLETFDPKSFQFVKRGGASRDFQAYEDKVKRVFDACNRLGIGTTAAMMLGLPYETRESLQRNVKILEELKPSRAYFSYLSLYPGAPLFDDLSKEKEYQWLGELLKSDVYEKYVEEPEITTQLGLITGHGVRGLKPNYIKREVFEQSGKIEYDFERMKADYQFCKEALEKAGIKVGTFEEEMGLREQ